MFSGRLCCYNKENEEIEMEENGRVRVSRAVVRVLFAGPYRPFEIVSTDGPTPPYTHVLEKENKTKNISSPLRQKQPPLKHDISFSTKSEKKKKHVTGYFLSHCAYNNLSGHLRKKKIPP